MERFIKGDVVVISFPFSNLTRNKRRPAFVIKDLPDNDILLCQITSKPNKDNFSIQLLNLFFLKCDRKIFKKQPCFLKI